MPPVNVLAVATAVPPNKLEQKLVADAARKGELGREGRDLKSIRVTVAESPAARAWYEAPLW